MVFLSDIDFSRREDTWKPLFSLETLGFRTVELHNPMSEAFALLCTRVICCLDRQKY